MKFKRSINLSLSIILSLFFHVAVFGASYAYFAGYVAPRKTMPLAHGQHLTSSVSIIPVSYVQSQKGFASKDGQTRGPATLQKTLRKSMTPSKAAAAGSALPMNAETAQDVIPAPGNIHPTYPIAARDDGQEATCHLRIYIQNGRVTQVVNDGVGQNCLPIFENAARSALLNWRFKTSHQSNSVIEKTIPITFKLNNQ